MNNISTSLSTDLVVQPQLCEVRKLLHCITLTSVMNSLNTPFYIGKSGICRGIHYCSYFGKHKLSVLVRTYKLCLEQGYEKYRKLIFHWKRNPLLEPWKLSLYYINKFTWWDRCRNVYQWSILCDGVKVPIQVPCCLFVRISEYMLQS